MIRVGFLGCAHIHADVYAQELQACRAKTVAVFDHDVERAYAFATPRGLAVATSPEHLCELADAVIITSEHVHYPELIQAAASCGKPVLCEKPLGVSAKAATAILESGAWASVAFPVRYAAPVRRAKALIGEGGLGRLLAMSGTNHGAFPGRFFGNKQLSGGGALIDHVVHLADALRWLTGCEFASVYAESSRERGVGDVEDAALVSLTTVDGAWAGIDPSWSRPEGMAGANDLRMTLWFEHGLLEVDAFARHGVLVRPDGGTEHLPYGTGMDEALLADWLAAIETGAPPPIPLRDGWKATEVALAALASAATGKTIRIPAVSTSTPLLTAQEREMS